MNKNGSSTIQTHRPGVFKQENKSHKTGRHRSKGSISIAKKGRSERCSIKKVNRELSREERRHKANQIRKNKRDEFRKLIRTQNDPPFIVALVSLNANISYFDILNKLNTTDGVESVWHAGNGYCVISVPRFKQRFMFVIADVNRIYHTLNVLRIADSVLFLTSVCDSDIDIDHVMACIIAQGIPSNVFLSVVDLQKLPKKKQGEKKEELRQTVTNFLPDVEMTNLETATDFLSYFRVLSSRKPDVFVQKDWRPYLLTEDMNFQPDDEGSSGSLVLSGFVRGKTLSPNDLVHITGWKDFRIKMIQVLADPYKPESRNSSEKLILTLYPDPEVQESLQSENIPDPMDAEQTWPTTEELKEAREENRKRLVKKVPKGFSEYQAAWIPDCDAENLSDLSDLEEEKDVDISKTNEDEMSVDDEDETKSHVTFATESDVFVYQTEPAKYDERMNIEEEDKMLQKIKEARADKMFPDEVDTPLDTAARVRFQKYRGLKSLRTSPWDVKENLPADYARCFQFQNFKRTEKSVRQRLELKTGASPGSYVNLLLEGVTEHEYEMIDRSMPLIAIGLLEHEQKMSVQNVLLRRPNVLQSDEPIKSKEELIFQCGYRRFKCCPIFSQLSSGNAHKYERFFQPDETVVATMFAPIQYTPCSVLVFKEHEDSSVELVATGKLISVDTDRVVVKKTVLSGHPFKVHRKLAVIRFMFYNAEDVEWFKPIELTTKYGRRGHIKEPLGTHGHMKCFFDKPIKSQDTVLLNLYKRVYPKWSYTNLTTALYTSN